MPRNVTNPIEDRLLARLKYYHEEQEYFQHVNEEIRVGYRRQWADVTVNPIAVHIYCSGPVFSDAGRQAKRESRTKYRCVIGIEGAHIDNEEARRNMNETLDDVRDIICDLEQRDRFQERAGTYGEITKIAAVEDFVSENNEEEHAMGNPIWYARAVFHLIAYLRWGAS